MEFTSMTVSDGHSNNRNSNNISDKNKEDQPNSSCTNNNNNNRSEFQSQHDESQNDQANTAARIYAESQKPEPFLPNFGTIRIVSLLGVLAGVTLFVCTHPCIAVIRSSSIDELRHRVRRIAQTYFPAKILPDIVGALLSFVILLVVMRASLFVLFRAQIFATSAGRSIGRWLRAAFTTIGTVFAAIFGRWWRRRSAEYSPERVVRYEVRKRNYPQHYNYRFG